MGNNLIIKTNELTDEIRNMTVEEYRHKNYVSVLANDNQMIEDLYDEILNKGKHFFCCLYGGKIDFYSDFELREDPDQYGFIVKRIQYTEYSFLQEEQEDTQFYKTSRYITPNTDVDTLMDRWYPLDDETFGKVKEGIDAVIREMSVLKDFLSKYTTLDSKLVKKLTYKKKITDTNLTIDLSQYDSNEKISDIVDKAYERLSDLNNNFKYYVGKWFLKGDPSYIAFKILDEKTLFIFKHSPYTNAISGKTLVSDDIEMDNVYILKDFDCADRLDHMKDFYTDVYNHISHILREYREKNNEYKNFL